MEKTQSTSPQQLLRITHPTLYNYLMKELEAKNIHSYDIRATTMEIDEGLEIQVNYGDDYSHMKSFLFPKDSSLEINDEFCNFCKEIGDACKETLIADYFNMVKP